MWKELYGYFTATLYVSTTIKKHINIPRRIIPAALIIQAVKNTFEIDVRLLGVPKSYAVRLFCFSV